MHKTIPPGVQQYRGPNHVLYSRRSSRVVLRKRLRKLLTKWPEVHLHGLGAAIAPTIVLATELVEESDGRYETSCATSTEVLVDQADDESEEGRIRHNSAIHVTIRLKDNDTAVRVQE